MLKKMQFISSDGTPTDLYSKFKSDLQGVKPHWMDCATPTEIYSSATNLCIEQNPLL